MNSPYVNNMLVEFDQLRKRNRSLLLIFQAEVKQLASQILNPCKQQIKAPTPVELVDYYTRRKVVETKDMNLQKTKKEEALFECIELEMELKDQQPQTDIRTLSSPILGGFMVTDLKKDYEHEVYRCTEFK